MGLGWLVVKHHLCGFKHVDITLFINIIIVVAMVVVFVGVSVVSSCVVKLARIAATTTATVFLFSVEIPHRVDLLGGRLSSVLLVCVVVTMVMVIVVNIDSRVGQSRRQFVFEKTVFVVMCVGVVSVTDEWRMMRVILCVDWTRDSSCCCLRSIKL